MVVYLTFSPFVLGDVYFLRLMTVAALLAPAGCLLARRVLVLSVAVAVVVVVKGGSDLSSSSDSHESSCAINSPISSTVGNKSKASFWSSLMSLLMLISTVSFFPVLSSIKGDDDEDEDDDDDNDEKELFLRDCKTV